jgi:hypothetical protein
VTSIREYLPKNDEVDRLLRRHDETNYRICAYMYLKNDKPKTEILDEQRLDNNLSILCLHQHVSCYRPKILSKINNKSYQDENHNLQIVVMDFRLAHFDPLSLKREIMKILANNGMELPSLGGILVSTPKELNSDMLRNESDYVFINNTYCKSQHTIMSQLNSYSLATTSNWVTLNHIFIKKSSNIASISLPCLDCPGKNELDSMGLPTF